MPKPYPREFHDDVVAAARRREPGVTLMPVAVTCRVLKIARQPCYQSVAEPVRDADWVQAHRASALFDAHREDLEFGYRMLVDEARDTDHQPLVERILRPVRSANCWPA